MRKVLITLLIIINLFYLSAYAEENTFNLNSPSFSTHGFLPITYTCDGKDISPELNWTGVPPKTASFALLLSDPDAPGGLFYHWVVYNIPKTITHFSQGINPLPAEARVGKNTWDKPQYKGPCPPKGTTHRYIFTLFALDTTLTLPENADANTVMNAMQNHVLGEAQLMTSYGH